MRRSSAAGMMALAIVAGLGAAPAAAQTYPSPSGRNSNVSERDPVTGYLCVTPGCDVVRLPNANCLCKKENPGERDLSQLLLTPAPRVRADSGWPVR